MINTHLPRIVLVTRKTPLTLLVEHHGTLGQAQFYLKTRGQDIAEYEAAHQRFEAALALVTQCIPPDRRRIRLDRGNLDRFLFAPDDIVVIVGQDGLVPNAAKYLNGQMAIGVNPDPERYDGVLVPHRPQSVARLLAWTETCQGGEYHIQRRVMALAEREDGQRLLALNEVFIGHRSHQSARYRLRVGEQQERPAPFATSGACRSRCPCRISASWRGSCGSRFLRSTPPPDWITACWTRMAA
jgi:NAD kinase